MRQIKFRQWMPRFKEFHMWGFMSPAEFAGPANSETINSAHLHSQQFTGLLDNNGKEIYEGDILEYEDKAIYEKPLFVSFNQAGFCAHDADEYLHWDEDGDDEDHEECVYMDRILAGSLVIVGNIHENTELLCQK